MTLFAIISGFWFKERTTKQLATIFLWPCFLFSILNNILGVTSPHYPDYLYNFSYKAGYAMWYLLALFIYSLIIKNLRNRFSPFICLITTIIIAVIIGILPIPNRILDIQRISRLLPCFAYGNWLRDVVCKNNVTLPSLCNIRLMGGIYLSFRLCCAILFASLLLINLALYVFYPGVLKYDRFIIFYGLNRYGFFVTWGLYLIRIVASTCLIAIVPNKNYWFSKYGSRTMNAYLLHMLIIFPFSWCIVYNLRYEWYGIFANFVLVPLFCTFLLNSTIDKIMKKILFR